MRSMATGLARCWRQIRRPAPPRPHWSSSAIAPAPRRRCAIACAAAATSRTPIEHAIARLHEWRYLDDADFARRWVENRTAHRPRGKRLLQQELRHKGIDSETARDVIDEAELDETGAAEALARRRLPSYAGDDPAAIRRRLGAYLARRGYGYDVIRVALDRALGEETRVTGDG